MHPWINDVQDELNKLKKQDNDLLEKYPQPIRKAADIDDEDE